MKVLTICQVARGIEGTWKGATIFFHSEIVAWGLADVISGALVVVMVDGARYVAGFWD
jgi:hypothetical protein